MLGLRRGNSATGIAYARFFLFLPLAVGVMMPIFAPALRWVAFISEIGALFIGYLIIGPFAALPAYAAFAAAALLYLRNHDAAAYFRLAPLAPIAFLPFFGTQLYFTELLGETGRSVESDIIGIAGACLFTLPVAYTYVGLFLVGARVALGPARPDPSTPICAR